MTNELLKSAMKINEGVKKYGDVSFTTKEVIGVIKNVSMGLVLAIDEKYKDQLTIFTSYSTLLMEAILQMAQAKKEGKEDE